MVFMLQRNNYHAQSTEFWLNIFTKRVYYMTWILVFWLTYPENYAVHQQFKNERECRDAENVWNKRLTMVKSDIRAECRVKD
jgi:hypothetical protein